MKQLQPVIIVEQYSDLYRLLARMADLTHLHLNPLELAFQPDPPSIIVWSPEPYSPLLDEFSKVELLERYARKLGVQITLSAASNLQLREWGHRVGWLVLWDVPELDRALSLLQLYPEHLADSPSSEQQARAS